MLQVGEYRGSCGPVREIELEMVNVDVCVVGSFHDLAIGNANGDAGGGNLLVVARVGVADPMT